MASANFLKWLSLRLRFRIIMSKEIYQEIKLISGEELRKILTDLDNVYDLGTQTVIGSHSESTLEF